MESVAAQIEYLRTEIASRNTELLLGVAICFLLATVSYMMSVAFEGVQLTNLCLAFIISGTFWVAREEYLLKRPVPWIEMASAKTADHEQSAAQAEIPTWETYLKNLKSRRYFLAPVDFLCGFAALYMAASCLSLSLDRKSLLARQIAWVDSHFALLFLIVEPLAIVSIGVGQWAKNK